MENTNASYYLVDVDNPNEIARLLDVHIILTSTVGLLANEIDLSRANHVLDIACGTGGWVLDIAREYPHLQVTGMDISPLMIRYANAQNCYENADFICGTASDPLPFDDKSLDGIQIRFLFSAMSKAGWIALIQECFRVLRPGGWIQWIEMEVCNISNSIAFETLVKLMARAFYEVQGTFSPDGKGIGLVPIMGRLLRKTGFIETKVYGHIQEGSYGTAAHTILAENIVMLFINSIPYFVEKGFATKEEIIQWIEQFRQDAQQEEFCFTPCYQQWVGLKPKTLT